MNTATTAGRLDPTAFRALTFDVVGTLIDFETGIMGVLRPWVRTHGLAASETDLLEAFALAEARYEAEMPDRPFRAIVRAIYRDLAHEWHVPYEAQDADAFADSIGLWPAFPDAVDALAYLGEHYVLAALTNADRYSMESMAVTLGNPFDRAFTADLAGAYKPARAMFEYALDALAENGIPRDQVLHVAQSQHHDIVPARALGLTTIWVERRHDRDGWGATPPPREAAEPDLRVTSLTELVALHRSFG
jgi:2-haloalkanoic acid dehalogenase type II